MKEFVRVIYEEGSITKAAKRMYISQPSLSMTLKRLESELGARLFDRATDPLQLTEAGKIYLDCYDRYEQMQADMYERINDLRDGVAGHIRVGGAHFITTFLLLKLIKDFQSRYPKAQIDLTEGNSEQLYGMLEDGQIDLLLDYGNDGTGIACVPLLEETVYLAVPKSIPISPEKAAKALTREDILGGKGNHADDAFDFSGIESCEFVVLKKKNNMHDIAQTMFTRYGITPHIPFETDQLVTAYYATVYGTGMSFATDRIIHAINDGGELRFFALPRQYNKRTLFFYKKAGSYVSKVTEHFMAFAKEVFRTDADSMQLCSAGT